MALQSSGFTAQKPDRDSVWCEGLQGWVKEAGAVFWDQVGQGVQLQCHPACLLGPVSRGKWPLTLYLNVGLWQISESLRA